MHPFLVDQRPYLARASSPAPSTSSSSSSSSLSEALSIRSVTPESSRSIHTAHSRTTSTNSLPEVDATCLRFMASTANDTYLFGSVSFRSSSLGTEERALRRELAELRHASEVREEVKPEKKKRFGRIF